MLLPFAAARTHSFYDYEARMSLIMTQSIATTGRREADAYPGTVEAGRDVAMSLLANHVCLGIASILIELTFIGI